MTPVLPALSMMEHILIFISKMLGGMISYCDKCGTLLRRLVIPCCTLQLFPICSFLCVYSLLKPSNIGSIAFVLARQHILLMLKKISWEKSVSFLGWGSRFKPFTSDPMKLCHSSGISYVSEVYMASYIKTGWNNN